MPSPLTATQQEILASAARLIVEDGFEYGPAKEQAVKQLGLPPRTSLPDNNALEEAVQEYISIFCADTQPQELRILREIAARWMRLMQLFSPLLSGAVWRGTATRHSDIHLQLYCENPKMPEIFLLNKQIRYASSTIKSHSNQNIPVLSTQETVPEWQQRVHIHMALYDFNDIRGALKPDAKGRSLRASLNTLLTLLT